MKLPSAFLTLSALVALAAASAASAVPDSPATTTARASGPPTRAQIAAPAPIQALPAQPQVLRFPVNDAKGLLLTCIAPEIETNPDTDLFQNCTLAPGRTLDDVMHTFVQAIHFVQQQKGNDHPTPQPPSEEKSAHDSEPR